MQPNTTIPWQIRHWTNRLSSLS